jgi:hypothetical protein
MTVRFPGCQHLLEPVLPQSGRRGKAFRERILVRPFCTSGIVPMTPQVRVMGEILGSRVKTGQRALSWT